MLTLHRSSHIAICCTAVAFLAGCAKKDDTPVDTTAASSTVAAPPAPAAVNLADVAGTWNVTATPASGTDTTPTKYSVTATNTTSGWTISLPNRPKMDLKVATDADSIMMDAGPYESVRRKGVQVTTHSVSRLQGGNLVGTTTAHYSVKTADSVLTLNTMGTRAK